MQWRDIAQSPVRVATSHILLQTAIECVLRDTDSWDEGSGSTAQFTCQLYAQAAYINRGCQNSIYCSINLVNQRLTQPQTQSTFPMAPSIADSTATPVVPIAKDTAPAVKSPLENEPLKLSGSLELFDSFDVTTVIGREFPTANLKEWLHAPNSDELLRDLAITSN